jgi:hypothetical protein
MTINHYRNEMNRYLIEMRNAQDSYTYDSAYYRFRDAQAKKEALQANDRVAAAADAQEQAEQRLHREVSDPYGQARGWGS